MRKRFSSDHELHICGACEVLSSDSKLDQGLRTTDAAQRLDTSLCLRRVLGLAAAPRPSSLVDHEKAR
jgi:hypothetical protein